MSGALMNAPTLRWPPVADEPRLATIESFVLIGRPAQAVFEFATNASLWRYWHPATASVTATPPRPLAVGERVTESIRAGGRRFDATWTVLACEPPSLWVIATDTPQGDSRIVYELRSDGASLTRHAAGPVRARARQPEAGTGGRQARMKRPPGCLRYAGRRLRRCAGAEDAEVCVACRGSRRHVEVRDPERTLAPALFSDFRSPSSVNHCRDDQ
jgi:uncharacterized protein YndB with AHSA1/START domain